MPSWFLTVMPTGTSWGIFFILLVGVLALVFCFMGWHVLRAVLSSKITWIGLVIVLVAFILLAPKKIDEKKGARIDVQHMVNAISTYVEKQQTITLLRVRADSIFSYDQYRRKGEERKKVGKAVREIRGHGDLRIDLTKVEIKRDEATKTITVTLPSPQVYEPTVDTEAENFYWRNEGEVNQEGLADMLGRRTRRPTSKKSSRKMTERTMRRKAIWRKDTREIHQFCWHRFRRSVRNRAPHAQWVWGGTSGDPYRGGRTPPKRVG